MDGSDIKMETITGEAAAAETAAVEQVATVDGTAGASGLALEVGTELDALASSIQLQEELERLNADAAAVAAQVTTTHAMITADGQTVAVNYDPETGQYVTPDGQAFMVATGNEDDGTGAGVVGEQTEEEASGLAMDTGEEGVVAATAAEASQEEAGQAEEAHQVSSDLTSLAEAAETHHVMVDMQDPSHHHQVTPEGVAISQPQMTAGVHEPMTWESAVATTAPTEASTETVSYQTVGGQTIRIVKKEVEPAPPPPPQPQYKIMNPDGTLSDLPTSSQPQQVRVIGADGTVTMRLMNPDGTFVEEQPPPVQQIRIVNSDGSVTMGTVPQRQHQQQQIRVLNADGSITPLNTTGMRMVQQQQTPPEPKVRIVTSSGAGGTSPIKTTMTLTQAQQLGLIPGSGTSGGSVKILPKSPSKMVRTTADGRTVIVQSPQKQLVIKGQTGRFLQTGGSSQGQVIRIPGNTASPSSGGTIQKMNIGGKVQYVRVMSDSNRKSGQGLTVKGVTPILPSNQSEGQVMRMKMPAKVASPYMSNRSSQDEEEMYPDEPEDIKPLIKEEPVEKYEASGVRPRKPCNCTKSMCLKLYCECFANGEFCNNCNCNNCHNNIENEKQRQKSIKQCLDRNPTAFKPKIGRLATDGERRHHRGCHCKRSGCLKNYCECYEAKVPCNETCKCIGCKNIDEEPRGRPDGDGKTEGTTAAGGAGGGSNATGSAANASGVNMLLAAHRRTELRPNLKAKLGSINAGENGKQPFSFVTSDVVEATCQCLLAQAEEAESHKLSQEETEGMIIGEFGRCLKQIIDMANKAAAGIKAADG